MRLWIDGQCLQTASNRRGIGRYVSELIRAIADFHPEVELSISFNAAMPDAAIAARAHVSRWIAPENIHAWHGACRDGEATAGSSSDRQLSALALGYHVEALDPDVALAASPFEGLRDASVPFFKAPGSNVFSASIFYDAIPYRFPHQYLQIAFQNAAYLRRLEQHRNFDLHLCISDFAQRELHDILGTDLDTVTIDAGLSEEFERELASPQAGRAAAIPHRYILYVGGLDWRKNVPGVATAIGELPLRLRNTIVFVVAGNFPDEAFAEVANAWIAAGLNPARLIRRDDVSESELVKLLKGAALLVQPSFMEGFGLTALEAMACRTPVIAANAGALPEIVADERLLFDPSSTHDMSNVIERLLSDEALVEQCVAQATERSRDFTWKRTADTAVQSLLSRLADRREASPKTVTSATELKRRYALQAIESGLTSERAAKALALAEPKNDTERRRLIVDASSTILVDHKSGIQRVVKKISGNLFDIAQRSKFDHPAVMTFCNGPDGWYDAVGNVDRPPDKKTAPRIVPETGDTILMLDSSWEFHASHRPFFLSARLRNAEIVSCLYDLVPLKVPAFCGTGMPIAFSDWFRTALVFSTGFVCISKAIADELHHMLEAIGYPRPMKIGYWPLGADFADEDRSEVPAETVPLSTDEDVTFLMVGTLEPRKGHRVALDAFSQLWARGVGARLVIVGKVGWGIDTLVAKLRAHDEFGKRLVWREGIDDAALVGLYRKADALIASSYAEGFGLPIVEAGHFGKPVIASDIAVFREVSAGAKGAEFFPVGDSGKLADMVEAFIARRRDAAASDSERPMASEGALWPTWKESAEALERLIVEDGWYKTYRPVETRSFASLTDIGTTRMAAPLSPQDIDYRLELVDAPIINQSGHGDIGVTVALTNLSQSVWSSLGTLGKKHGIILATRPAVGDGASGEDPMDMAEIPFVLVPGDTIYLYVSADRVLRNGFADGINITPYQVGSGWMGTGIDIAQTRLSDLA